jgi:DNA polymerase elongation subunit (family B)
MGKENLLRILPTPQKFGKTNHVIKFYDKDQAKAVTEEGRCVIKETLKKLKESGFDGKMLKTNYERFGDTIFPVTYGPNGLVIIDYPNEPFK